MQQLRKYLKKLKKRIKKKKRFFSDIFFYITIKDFFIEIMGNNIKMNLNQYSSLIKIEPSKENKEFIRIIRAIFGLTKKQSELFLQLQIIAKNETCIMNLVNELDSERSIVQKYLRVLLKKNLVKRRSVTLSEFQERCRKNNRTDIEPGTTKGYLFLYAPISKKELIEKAQEITDHWIEVLEKR